MSHYQLPIIQVFEIVKEMNIQLSNKCQFLPQVGDVEGCVCLCGFGNASVCTKLLNCHFSLSKDMVVEFAKMDECELLEETEKTVSSGV